LTVQFEMASRITRKQDVYGSEILEEDSKKALISYHMMQLKREQLISPAQSAIIPILDLLDDVRSKWKLAEDSLKDAESKVKKLNGQVNTLSSDNKRLEDLNADYDRRLNTVKMMIQKKLDDTSEFDQVLNINSNNKVKIKVKTEPATQKDPAPLRFTQDLRRSKSVNPKPKISRPKRTHDSLLGAIKEEANPLAPKIKRSRGNQEKLKAPSVGKVPNKSKAKRSVSASRILDDDSARRRLAVRSPHIINSLNASDLRNKTPNGTEIAWTQGRAIAECLHKFKSHRTLMGTCEVCNRQVNFITKVVQCESCKVCVHENCKSKVPLPCLPASSFSNTPGRNDTRRALPDFCPTNPPFIPALLIRCIIELEKDRLNTEGIYQVAGSKEEILRLYKEFSKSVPNLTLESTEVITGCIKMFLRKLKEPLIPRSSYNEFMQSADDDEKLIEALEDLPDTNRDTLAYLCLHLQKVVSNSRVNKMTVENLAAGLCQSILSSNALNTSGYVSKNNDPFDEAVRQRVVLEHFLKMPSKFWSDYLNARTDSKGFTSAAQTSREVTAKGEIRSNSIGSNSDCSVLGPVSYTPPSHFTRRFPETRRIKEPFF